MPQSVLKLLSIHRMVFPLRLTFSHNLASRNEAETLLVAATMQSGAVGYGQALPRAYLTGETIQSAVEDIRDRLWPRFRDVTFPEDYTFAGLLPHFMPVFAQADAERKNAAYAAVEVAVMDALLKERGAPAGFPELFNRDPLPLVGVIGGSGPRKAGWLARTLRWLGYSRFKVKVGIDEAADDARLRAVRRIIGPKAWLAVDANGAWGYDEAVHRMRALRRFGVSLVEEPIRSEDGVDVDYQRLEREGGVSVMADESVCTLADADGLLRRGSPSWWNLRLAKNGGFSGMAALAERARKGGISVYGGVLVGETGLLTAAGRVGMLMAGASCGEYGFSRFFLRGDPFRGSPVGYFGRLPAPTGREKGLGIRPAWSGEQLPGDIVWKSGG